MTSGTASLRPEPILAFMLGVIAFSPDIVARVLVGKLTSVLSRWKINPMIGGWGISAFHMSSGAVQKLGSEANPHSHLLMHGVGANAVGQITSVIAGEVMLMLVPIFSWRDISCL